MITKAYFTPVSRITLDHVYDVIVYKARSTTSYKSLTREGADRILLSAQRQRNRGIDVVALATIAETPPIEIAGRLDAKRRD